MSHEAPRAGCDRLESRLARRLILENIVSVAGELPPQCPLAPSMDVFLHQEQHKKSAGRQGYVKCLFCGKTFRNDFYMDRHLDNKHSDQFLPNATTCLADFCDVRGRPLLCPRHPPCPRPRVLVISKLS